MSDHLHFDVRGFQRVEQDRIDAQARAARYAAIDEHARRVKVWIGIQAAADRAHLAGRSYTRSIGQLKRWRS